MPLRFRFTAANSLFTWALTLAVSVALLPTFASAQVVYANDFETNTAGFSPGGSITSLTRTSLPTDSGGLSSPNQSTYLGRLGSGIAKSGSIDEIATLSLTGLSAGTNYSVAFDLLIGASWDGSANGFGPDSWRFAVNGVRLVDTTFSNGQQGVNVGAYSPQRYSDTTYTSTTGPDFPRHTGADFAFSPNNTNYSLDYSIYLFGRGVGNPYLEFTATSSTATLEFARYGNTTDSSDEYWALDNLQVTAVPEPSSMALASIAGLAALTRHMRKRRSAT
ncbi:MAG: PEP-CTERM sorting domain-containing protein [Gemmataceae bacterium]